MRPGVAGSKNAGRPIRLMGGKGISNKKNIPGPFNHAWAEVLVEIAGRGYRSVQKCAP